MSATVQHAVIEKLVQMWAAAVDFPVFDGPSLSVGDEGMFLMVGYDPIDNDGSAASTRQDYKAIGGRSKAETGTIRSTVTAWSGDSETKPRREKVAAALSDLEAAIRNDISLGGLVLWANFGPGIDLNQMLTTEGNQVYARIDVTYEARI